MSAKRRKAIRRKPWGGPAIKPHVYLPDASQGSTWSGEVPCKECKLPPASRAHIDPVEESVSDRILGEGEA